MALRLVASSLALLLMAVSCTSSGGEATAIAEVVTETAPLGTSGDQPGLAVTLTDVSELVKAVEASVVTVTQTQLQLDDVQGGDGAFSLTTTHRTAGPQAYRARKIIIASGYYDIPVMMNVPGEDLPKVIHYYKEPHPFYDCVRAATATQARATWCLARPARRP